MVTSVEITAPSLLQSPISRHQRKPAKLGCPSQIRATLGEQVQCKCECKVHHGAGLRGFGVPAFLEQECGT